MQHAFETFSLAQRGYCSKTYGQINRNGSAETKSTFIHGHLSSPDLKPKDNLHSKLKRRVQEAWSTIPLFSLIIRLHQLTM
ncbi:hypothetical protein ATANTOWER_008698 [Ataeniobius toweri]|uniref:Uncharacterized protein n=1 Tax=Ataeniobius toweri TaxID=208326 RepID=A0ABU7BRJ6_9TELE|nr:hypothetical protein [Ataeniobius toweri]